MLVYMVTKMTHEQKPCSQDTKKFLYWEEEGEASTSSFKP